MIPLGNWGSGQCPFQECFEGQQTTGLLFSLYKWFPQAMEKGWMWLSAFLWLPECSQVLLLHKLPTLLWETPVISGRVARASGRTALFPRNLTPVHCPCNQSMRKARSTDSVHITDSLNYWHWSGPGKWSCGEMEGGAQQLITGSLNACKSCKEAKRTPYAPSPHSRTFA